MDAQKLSDGGTQSVKPQPVTFASLELVREFIKSVKRLPYVQRDAHGVEWESSKLVADIGNQQKALTVLESLERQVRELRNQMMMDSLDERFTALCKDYANKLTALLGERT